MAPRNITASERLQMRFVQLGIFMAMFANAESELRSVLRQVVGVDEATALAIFSGTRTEQATKFIRRCYEARNEKVPTLLDAALSRLSAITNFRNDLIHYVPDMFADEPVVTNETAAIREDAIRRVPFDDKTMFKFQIDLAAALTILRSFPKLSSAQRKLEKIDRPPAWLGRALAPKSQDHKKRKPNTHPK